MSNKFILNLVCLFLLFPFLSNAEVTVYKTYEDYTNNVGEKYGQYKTYISVMGPVKLVFTKNKKRKTISCKDIWGFKADDKLYRVHKKYNQPARVIVEGDLIYYENGIAHLEMTKNDTEIMNVEVGAHAYFSKNLSSELVPIPIIGQTGRKGLKKFMKENPQYKSIFDCMDGSTIPSTIIDCMKQ